jgi:hypothetical protein
MDSNQIDLLSIKYKFLNYYSISIRLQEKIKENT